MKTLGFKELLDKKFSISDISVIHQTNAWSVCQHPEGRFYNGFLLFDGGEGDISCDGEVIHAEPGVFVYLPSGSTHKVTAKERSLHFYRINFVLSDLSDGEKIVFSRGPLLISRDTPRSVFSLAERMRENTLSEGGLLKNIASLAELLDYMGSALKENETSRISSAVYYVENHYTEDIDLSHLAKMSYISEAHLFRLFKKETGMSPIEYKNALRIKKAEELLLDNELTVSDISELIGFENSCYFSRIFKKYTALSPLEYRKKYIR